jgi:hemerythrin-like domain-containing protein
LLVTVANEARGGPLDADHREALVTAVRYFKHAAPNHTLDEEESLFPRMRFIGDPRARTIFGLLHDLSRGHDVAEDLHAQVEQLVERWLSDGELSGKDVARLKEVLDELQAFYRQHIAVEERDLFPLAARLLTRGELEGIGREMAARRGVDNRAFTPLTA